jgi:hypothetical protein
MNREITINKFKGISFIVFLLFSSLIIPMNFGFAAETNGKVPDFYEDLIKPQPNTVENVENTCGTPVNVKDSLIMSVVTLCIPGILEKVKQWNEISCEAAVCKYNAIKGGIDPSFCEKQKEYKFCKFVWGEIFSVPPLTIIEMYKDMVKELIANPVGILYGVGTTAARSYLTTCGTACPSYITTPTAGFLFIVDITGVVQTLQDMLENGFDDGKTNQNYCEQARDIKEELEIVIEQYKKLQSFGGSE